VSKCFLELYLWESLGIAWVKDYSGLLTLYRSSETFKNVQASLAFLLKNSIITAHVLESPFSSFLLFSFPLDLISPSPSAWRGPSSPSYTLRHIHVFNTLVRTGSNPNDENSMLVCRLFPLMEDNLFDVDSFPSEFEDRQWYTCPTLPVFSINRAFFFSFF
jgi:hypothetical protein